MRKIVLLGSTCCLVSACATTPKNMIVTYALPRVDQELSVTKSVTCDKYHNLISVMGAPTHTEIYSAATDPDAIQTMRIANVDGPFSDADLTFDFKDDGRLAGVNIETTGKGDEIVKAAMSVVGPLVAGVVGGRSLNPKDACAKIATWGGDNKTITLTYGTTIPFPKNGVSGEMEADASSAFYHRELTSFIGSVCVEVGQSVPRRSLGVPKGSAGRNEIELVLRQPATSKVTIRNFEKPACDAAGRKSEVWSTVVQVPQNGEPYVVLIPKAAAFGKQNFTLALSDAGSVTQLKYGKANGVAAAITATKEGIDAFTVTPAESKQQADDKVAAIAAQEKLAACLADHAKCSE